MPAISSASVFFRARIGLKHGTARCRASSFAGSGSMVVMTSGSLRSKVSRVMSSSFSSCSTNFRNAGLPMTSTRSM